MCGRTVTLTNFNHCPTQQDTIYTANGQVEARWGIHFPHLLINARDDTKSQRFKQLREKKRCVVDALGYYEWKTTDKSKQPYYITSGQSEKVLKFAAMYDNDVLGDGKLSYVTMTCSPTGPLSEIHDRMPVILDEKDVPDWLSKKSYAEVAHLVKPYEKLVFFPVSTKVNDVRNSSPECIVPINLKKNKQSKLEFSNGILITPEKKKRKVHLEPQETKKSDQVDDKPIIDLSEDIKPMHSPEPKQRATARKTPIKKLPKNQLPITKFFSPS